MSEISNGKRRGSWEAMKFRNYETAKTTNGGTAERRYGNGR
ncbi:MAG: hypothetical protein ACLFWL_19010 [Candidatus Brocadiia bacterium]